MTDSICPRCCGDNAKPNANSSYRERLCAPIAEKLGEFGFAIHGGLWEATVQPVGGMVVFEIKMADDITLRLSPPEARTIANGLNQLADIVDQLKGTWTGKGHPKFEGERIG